MYTGNSPVQTVFAGVYYYTHTLAGNDVTPLLVTVCVELLHDFEIIFAIGTDDALCFFRREVSSRQFALLFDISRRLEYAEHDPRIGWKLAFHRSGNMFQCDGYSIVNQNCNLRNSTL